ncbi:MAG: alpha-L-fucosidase [Candidatus Zipacnadales bacterium]
MTSPVLAERLEWFRNLKFGLFVHWGPYSQWGCIESWPLVEEATWARPDDLDPWVERDRDLERFRRDYFALNRTFNPVEFNPQRWAEIAKYAGMRYVVFTTKHHDGFCMFDTRYTDYRITHPDCPFSSNSYANVTKVLFDTFREQGFGIGAYFSKADWHSPYYWSPDRPAQTRNPNYDTAAEPEKWEQFVRFVHGQIEELMTDYGQVDILWLDGGQVRPPTQDIRMAEIAAMARSHQPGLIIVDRTVGGEYENYLTPEQQVPDKPLLDQAWESCITMGKQWSYKPNDEYKSAAELIHLLIGVVAKGGNLLLNIGPGPDGRLPEEAASRLREIGDWMQTNAEAIHGTRPVPPYRVGPLACTRRGRYVYALYLDEDNSGWLPPVVEIPFTPGAGSAVRMLGVEQPLEWTRSQGGAEIIVPPAVYENPPGKYAWVFRVEV